MITVREEEDMFSRPVRSVKENTPKEESDLDSISDLDDSPEKRLRMMDKEEEEEDDAFYEEMVERRNKKKQEKEERKKYQELHVNEDYV